MCADAWLEALAGSQRPCLVPIPLQHHDQPPLNPPVVQAKSLAAPSGPALIIDRFCWPSDNRKDLRASVVYLQGTLQSWHRPWQACQATAVLQGGAWQYAAYSAGCGAYMNSTGSQHLAAGCPCDLQATCAAGFVCMQPWGNASTTATQLPTRLASAVNSAAAGIATQLQSSQTFQQLALAAEPYSAKLTALYAGSIGAGEKGEGGGLLQALLSDGSSAMYLCQPCTYGQYCPPGSFVPPADSPAVQSALAVLQCPAGKYCPTPAETHDCPSGAFCSAGSVQPITCNMSTLVDEYPLLVAPERPPTILERVYLKGDLLAGNSCPANSTQPSRQCKAGSYCPEPGIILPCPAGHYCKAGSVAPTPCPKFTHCPEGSVSASLHYYGFLLIGTALKLLWGIYFGTLAIIRANQRKQLRTQEARNRLWRLLLPLFTPQSSHRQPSFQAIKAIRPRLTLDFHNLGLVLSDGSTILSGVTGRFAHSKVSAVMGPSGAGKSTFLNVLAGRATQYGKVSGAVRVNKRDIDIRRLQAITGFVPQEDSVHEDLTVRENLAYSARLRLPRGKASHEQQGIVEDVMDMLQLRHVQHQVVGTAEKRGVSGGQRKRVNIGLELVTVPSLLFLDEPTSGLDATAAVDIIQALKRMAQLGMNVVAVVHQPRYSIFTLFDTVLLLGTGGRLVFLGPSHLALPYFESLGFVLPLNENPADFCLDVLSGSVPPVGSGSFQPDDLNGLWHTYGLSWVRTQAKLTPPEPAQRQLPPDAARLDPGQLQLLEHAFDDCDSNADGAVTAAELRELLRGLGLQPTKRDVQTIMGELSIPRTGLLSKEAFMQYVRCGGRVQAAARRPSVYRVYSIEQYTIANVLSELSAAQIAPGLIERGATMKEIAAAVMSQAGASGSAQSGSLRAHMPAGGAAAATTATTAGPAAATLASAREDLPCRRSTSFLEPPEAVIPDAGSSFLNRDSAASLLLYTHERIAASDAWPPASLQPGQPHAPQQESPAGPFAMPASSHLSCAVGRSRTDTLDSSRSDTPMSVRIPPEAFQSPFAAAAALPAPAALQGPLQQEGSVAQSSVHSTLDGPLALSSGAMCGGALKLAGKGSGTTCGSAVEGKAKQLPAVQPCSTGGSMASSSGGRSSSGSSDGSRRGYRSTPGVARQFVVLLVRAGTKWARGWTSKFLDLLLLLLAGVVTGAMHGSHSGPWEMRGYTAQVMLTLGTLAAAAALSVFGKDRVVFGREQASGIRPLPYFLAHSVIQLIDITIQPLIFLAAYYSLTLPSIAFSQLYLAGLLVTWYCSSLGCLMSVVLRPANALVATIVVALMLGGFLNGVNPKYREMSPTMKRVSGLSFDRWVTEAVTIMEFSAYPQHMWPMTRAIIDNAGYCGMDQHPDGLLGTDSFSTLLPSQRLDAFFDIGSYCGGYAARALAILAVEGCVLRLVSFLALQLCALSFTIDPLKLLSWFKSLFFRKGRWVARKPSPGHGV